MWKEAIKPKEKKVNWLCYESAAQTTNLLMKIFHHSFFIAIMYGEVCLKELQTILASK